MPEEQVVRRIQGVPVCFRDQGDRWEGVMPLPAADQPSFDVTLDGYKYRARTATCMLLETADPTYRADPPQLTDTDEIVAYMQAFEPHVPEAMRLQSAWTSLYNAVQDLCNHMSRTFRPLLDRVPYEFQDEMFAMYRTSQHLLMDVIRNPPNVDSELRNCLLIFKATAHAIHLAITWADVSRCSWPTYSTSVANEVLTDVSNARRGSRYCWSQARGFAIAGLDRYFEHKLKERTADVDDVDIGDV